MKQYTENEIRAFLSTFTPASVSLQDSTMPQITIVTPSYQQAPFLERTIRSVLNQRYPNLEYIVIDGGSTDGSVEIIRRYESHLAYWVSESDAGHVDALAKGFARATGSILAFLNSDDFYLPGALAAVAARFDGRGNPDVVYGNTYRVDADECIIHEHRQTPFVPLGYVYGGSDLQQPSVFFKADLLRRVGGVDGTFLFSFDTHMFLQFVASGARFVFLRQFLSGFRVHATSKTSTLSHVSAADTVRLQGRYCRYATKSSVARCIRVMTRARRTAHYLAQGDVGWMLLRLAYRLGIRKI